MPQLLKTITINKFNGGISQQSKSGLANAFRFAANLDIFSDEDSVSLNPIPVKDSATTVTDLVRWIKTTLPYATDRYAYGDGGNIYKISSNVWSLDRTVSVGGAAGQGLVMLNNTLYYATSTTIGIKSFLNGSQTSVYTDDFFTDGINNLDQYNTGTGQTYTTPTAISEASTAKYALTFTKDPVKEIDILLAGKGTGNWTLTLHDGGNNVVTSQTVLNANLVANATYQPFIFATPQRVINGYGYHMHLTSTVADGTVTTGTASDFSNVNFNEYFGILITDINFHPAIQHTTGTLGSVIFGNNNYIAQFDGITYNPNKITLEPGYVVRALIKIDLYAVALCWRGTDMAQEEQGRAYFWDGIQPYYNFSKPITAGLPHGGISSKNRLFAICGTKGILTLGDDPFRTIQYMPKLGTVNKVEIAPGAIDNWDNKVHIGTALSTDDATGLQQGVYVFGNQTDRVITYTSVSTEVLSYGYQISTGDTNGTTMKIGCVAGFGSDLYISWKSQASSFGVDRASRGGNPAASGYFESFVIDLGVDKEGNERPMPMKTKKAIKLVIGFAALPTGCTVTPKVRFNRATTGGTNNDGWLQGTAALATKTTTVMDFSVWSQSTTRYKEIELGFILTATVNYPKITYVQFIYDPLVYEIMDS